MTVSGSLRKRATRGHPQFIALVVHQFASRLMTGVEKIAVIGLDCVPPEFLFDEFRSRMPNVSSLIEDGVHGDLRSTDPPITVPAWSSMLTGRTPGELGIYGYRNRTAYSYNNLSIATSNFVKEPRVWDLLSEAGKSSLVVGVPQTYPPSTFDGWMVSGNLTPDSNSTYTYPPELKEEIQEVSDGYLFDVEDVRTSEKEELLDQIYQLSQDRFAVSRHLVQEKDWDFFMMTDMAPDRLHHGFWKYHDSRHRKFSEDNPYRHVIAEFYEKLDEEVGRLLEQFDENTMVFLVSDHGAQPLDGGICINEWLRENNYLSLTEPPDEPVQFSDARVDWPRTKAWGRGGYYGRVFLNVKGREPRGLVEKENYEAVRNQLAEEIQEIPGENGEDLDVSVIKPDEHYPETNGFPPDLMVYFDDFSYRSVGSLGQNKLHTPENDTGPDSSNHDFDGVFLASGPGVTGRSDPLEEMRIEQVAPTILDLFGVEPETDLPEPISL